ncbi:DUF1579 domain-containing protein [Nitrosomonas ureae]|uniref:DUF1579 domain-containing protein n=1 Tax=Nitrosomonas ureae TaxID=44577 RepID=A0A1H9CWB5_9PROT|nr:DUF1579 domain-containing protein [Nitrosomonas ureae]SEQ05485.1 Protein of unknown function [Nitrosomonas ureae]
MRYLQFTLFIVFSLLMTMGVLANDPKNDKPMSHEEMMEVYTKLATPGEPHKLFTSLTGSWTTKTKEWMDPQKPAVESTGSVDIKLLLGGRFLQQEITGSMHGKPYSGIWTVAYDNLLKQYVSTWIDTMSTQIFIMNGTANADGKTITLTGQHAEVGGGYMAHRAIWKIVDGNAQEFIMYGTHHGGDEMKMLEVIYTRK